MNTKKLLLTTLAGLSIFSLTSCKGDENYPRSFTVNFVTGEVGQEISSQTVKEGYLLKGVSSPEHERENIFRGWYTDPNYENYFDVDTYRVFEDLTLYAKWTLNVDLSAVKFEGITEEFSGSKYSIYFKGLKADVVGNTPFLKIS